MDKNKFRVFLRFVTGEKAVGTEWWLDEAIHQGNQLLITDAEFKYGRANTDDAGRPGRPKSAHLGRPRENSIQNACCICSNRPENNKA